MADEKNLPMDEEEVEIYTLTDEETGEETDFELLASNVVDGVTYIALAPCDEDSDEYVILKVEEDENGEEILVTIDDDDEFNRVAESFDEELFGEIDYDEDEE
jgi:uncharacterized protein YrzB (UPF0473 family)